MLHPVKIKEKAVRLRVQGYSLTEISNMLSISKSTASLWLRDIKLNRKAQERIKQRKQIGYYKTQMLRKNKRKDLFLKYFSEAKITLNEINYNKYVFKAYTAIFFWCEGNKNDTTCVKFTNSDPKMIKVYLNLLRKSFNLDERKFRVLMHLHDYHNEEKQKKFWSIKTRIPLKQFYKTYHKSNTKIRKRKNYPGCIVVTYYDAKIAKQLFALYNTIAKTLGV